MTLEEFIEKVCARPMPQNPIGRVRTLAKELAEGASHELWATNFHLDRGEITYENVKSYIEKRWNNFRPSNQLLIANGYASEDTNSSILSLSHSAFSLLDTVEPANIFISYKRSESSAFALLVLSRLKAEGLEPFVDMSLVPGEIWHAGLQERIEASDYFIMLLGKQTLKSEVCLQELTWAWKSKRIIIPVWHNGFRYRPEKWNLPPEISKVLGQTHSIQVKEESALGYNNVIVELLNRFGITP
jgi:hypothetical protein